MSRNAALLVTILSCGLLAGGFACAQSGTHEQDRAQLERNKTVALQFFEYEDSMNIAGLRRILREDYIQHAPIAPDHREPLLALFENLAKEGRRIPPHDIVRVLAEDDHVWIYARQKIPDGTTRARMDMFRIQDGLIAEHWEIGETVNEGRRNVNDNFAVGRGPQDFTKQPRRVTKAMTRRQLEANKDVARQFYHAFETRDVETLRRIMTEDYIQHNATLGDGREALLTGLERARAEGRPRGEPNELIRMIAEGDYVWVFIRDGGGKTAQLNQFRIEDGRLVEHWGLYQEVPAESANGNDFFGYGRGPAPDFTL